MFFLLQKYQTGGFILWRQDQRLKCQDTKYKNTKHQNTKHPNIKIQNINTGGFTLWRQDQGCGPSTDHRQPSYFSPIPFLLITIKYHICYHGYHMIPQTTGNCPLFCWYNCTHHQHSYYWTIKQSSTDHRQPSSFSPIPFLPFTNVVMI